MEQNEGEVMFMALAHPMFAATLTVPLNLTHDEEMTVILNHLNEYQNLKFVRRWK